MRWILLVFVALIAVGCKKQIEIAREKGFSSVEEMKSMAERGYKNMAEYEAVLDFTPEKFDIECLRNRNAYDANCKGRRVIWYSRIKNYRRSIDVLRSKFNTDPVFEIDTPSLAMQTSSEDDGKFARVEGTIGDRGIVTPDLNSVRIVHIESTSEKTARERHLAEIEKQIDVQCKKQIQNAYLIQRIAEYGAPPATPETKANVAAAIRRADDALKECGAEVRGASR